MLFLKSVVWRNFTFHEAARGSVPRYKGALPQQNRTLPLELGCCLRLKVFLEVAIEVLMTPNSQYRQ